MKCIFNNCHKSPSFGYKNDKRLLYCSKHKNKDMINIRLHVCEKCNKLAKYCEEGNIPKFCIDHKRGNMIDLTFKKCIFINCDKLAQYNYSNEKKGIYCSNHKFIGMTKRK